jgi:hypothetical protein
MEAFVNSVLAFFATYTLPLQFTDCWIIRHILSFGGGAAAILIGPAILWGDVATILVLFGTFALCRWLLVRDAGYLFAAVT